LWPCATPLRSPAKLPRLLARQRPNAHGGQQEGERLVGPPIQAVFQPLDPARIDSMKTALGTYLEAFPDLQPSVDDVVVADDLVVARLRYAGTQQGSYMGMEPTGKQVQMRSTDIWRAKDGYAVEHWDNVEGTEFLQRG
jgi:predicted ester cyclase